MVFNLFKKDKSLHDLLTHKMREALDTERELSKALPRMADAASDPALKKGFSSRLEQTRNQAGRLERAFESLGERPNADSDYVVRSLIDEGEEFSSIDNPAVRDAGLISGARHIEDHEILMYQTMADWANEMGHNEAAKLFSETLKEEQETKKKLDHLAPDIYSEAHEVKEQKTE